MSLRAKLLLLALSTLVLPVSGWSLVRQFEGLLREGQAQVQMASAQVLARALVRQAEAFPAAGPALLVQRANAPLLLDGYDGDWQALGLDAQVLAAGLRVSLAWFDRQLHLFADIADRSRVRADAHWPQAINADQIVLVIEDDLGTHRLRLASAAPGPLIASSLHESDAPRLTGEWQEDLKGYRVELRFPVGYMPQRLGMDVLDYDDPALPPRRSGTGADLAEGRWVVQQMPDDLQALLAQLVPDGVRATLTQGDGFVLARAGAFPAEAAGSRAGTWRQLLYRLVTPVPPVPAPVRDTGVTLDIPELWQALSDRPALTWYGLDHGRGLLLATAVPVHVDGRVRGALLLERPSETLLLGGQALAGLLLASIVAMSAVGLILFGFAGHLSARIRTLSRAAERAIAREGRQAPEGFVASQATDELGDLSRSFGRLLEEVGAYSDYLRGLAGTLSHELHTPIAVVRSSLENLESEHVSDAARIYVERARAGVDRLGAIVRAMSEASRVERAIATTEGEDFDLRALIADCAEGYRTLLAPRTLQTMLPTQAVPFHGAPDLIVQALDKLVDNARGFCPPDGWVLIALARTANGVEIVVANAGPGLPDTMQDRLFDSLVSLRGGAQRNDGAPHLGFGLHVVRLVAQRHAGHARAANLPQGDGVEFRLVLHGMTRDA
ncbi:ATP-binding protein [Xanthomonadaceae bacterium JHOS43]|nr:ATP-binding protein [Xanthomonadaceae bacterium JHOS43]